MEGGARFRSFCKLFQIPANYCSLAGCCKLQQTPARLLKVLQNPKGVAGSRHWVFEGSVSQTGAGSAHVVSVSAISTAWFPAGWQAYQGRAQGSQADTRLPHHAGLLACGCARSGALHLRTRIGARGAQVSDARTKATETLIGHRNAHLPRKCSLTTGTSVALKHSCGIEASLWH